MVLEILKNNLKKSGDFFNLRFKNILMKY